MDTQSKASALIVPDSNSKFVLAVRHGDRLPMPWEPGWTGIPNMLCPLTPLGEAQGTRMGQILASEGFQPDLIWMSPPERTHQTTALMIAAMGYQSRHGNTRDGVNNSGALWELDDPTMMVDLQRTPEEVALPLVVGHAETLQAFTGIDKATFAPATVLLLRFEGATWRDVQVHSGEILWQAAADIA